MKDGIEMKIISFIIIDSVKKIVFETIGMDKIKQKVLGIFLKKQKTSESQENRFQETINQEA